MTTPTVEELRAVFNRAPLLRLRGYSFERAMTDKFMRLGLSVAAMGYRLNAARRGQPLPVQRSLELAP